MRIYTRDQHGDEHISLERSACPAEDTLELLSHRSGMWFDPRGSSESVRVAGDVARRSCANRCGPRRNSGYRNQSWLVGDFAAKRALVEVAAEDRLTGGSLLLLAYFR
jgi:hypothetical protein